MNLKSSFLYARKIIFSKTRKGEKSIGRKSLLGAFWCIGISIIPLVTVLFVSNGMIEGMTERIIGLSSGHLLVKFSAKSDTISNYDSFINASERISKVDGVEEVFPELSGMSLAVGKNIRTGANVRAVPSDIFTRNKSFASFFEVLEGDTSLSDINSCVIGEEISRKLNIHAGDTLRLINVNYSTSGKISPRNFSVKVSGVVSSGYQELDALWVFIPIEKGFSVMSQNTAQFSISIFTKDAFSSDLQRTRINVQNCIYGADGEPEIDYAYVYPWTDVNSSQFENFSSTKILLLLIMILIVLVASVNISAALIMVVMERKNEIAILKSTGASGRGISFAFIMVGFFCGLGGVCFGVPIGILGAFKVNEIIAFMERIINFFNKIIYIIANGNLDSYNKVVLLDPAFYLQKIQVQVPWSHLIAIIAGTIILSVLVSLIPAIKAGKEKPIETLRKI